jgi:ring-1,2-phenylacetyl-CoA epoxidase subunit PaaD
MLASQEIFKLLHTIADPEVPVLSILDLGIIRNVEVLADEHVVITITPTYSGCPAMDVISMQIRMLLLSAGCKKITIITQLSPAWTTDWMSESGKVKLKAYGIAPPVRKSDSVQELFEEDVVECPRCNSHNTYMISKFGATSCKAMFKCNDCLEPFEHFKCH